MKAKEFLKTFQEYIEENGDPKGLAPLYEAGGADIVICPEGVRVRPPLPDGSGTPAREWLGVCKRIGIPAELGRYALERLLEDIAPLVEKAAAGADEKWDGSRWVGAWSRDALEAIERAWDIVERYADDPDNYPPICDAYTIIFDTYPWKLDSVQKIWGSECPDGVAAYMERGETERLAECIYEYAKDEWVVRGGVEAIEEELRRLWESEAENEMEDE